MTRWSVAFRRSAFWKRAAIVIAAVLFGTYLLVERPWELRVGITAVPFEVAQALPEKLPMAPAPLDALSVEPPPVPYNVLLIVIDTARRDHFSCYGYGRETTPHLDALARDDGLLFTQCVAVSNWTLPTHASMLCGLYPPRHGAQWIPYAEFARQGNVPVLVTLTAGSLTPSGITLSEVLHKVGYRTGAILANHAFLGKRFGLDQGFQLYDARPGKDGEPYRDAAVIADEALAWLSQASDEPFFLFLNFMDPHKPYDPPERYARLFRSNEDDGQYKWSSKEFGQTKLRVMVDKQPLPADVWARYQDWYDGELAYADAEIHRLIGWLREAGQYDRTLMIVTSDHGESFGEHFVVEHAYELYEPEVAVPAILKLPHSRRRGEVLGYPVQHTDIVPTVWDVLEMRPEIELDGVSMLKATAGRDVFAEQKQRFINDVRNDRTKRMIVRNNLKYIEYSDGAFEMYDLTADPLELVDLSEQRPEKVDELRQALHAWQAQQRTTSMPGNAAPAGPDALEQLRTLGYVQ